MIAGLPLRRKLKPEAVPDKNLPKPIKSKPKASTEPIQSTSKLNNTKKLPALRKSLPTMKVRRFLKTGTVGKNMETTAASPDTLNKSEESAIAVLKEKEEIDRTNKVNNKVNRLPMRSSYRIAKKKSIECLSDSFVRQINTSNSRSTKFADKLKFMAKLQLRLERNENFIPLPQYDLKNSLQKVITNEKSLR
ncbi:hypothetical protein GWI33_009592 [Rhynchophorus ferrugineus]|uniref:Uncharacterized protein n=1 Tax=Rhynchophorus ferrugineus TaxID=354439 RepID=A0A834I9I0_RHYFE|nr:hypothetical protein GWI33_009593 [Rhynchophorus ferrugineus]KAF7276980.1 hypothetical protein GWI33_009592 [Rhynchophorus ferrugineus]